VRYLLIVGSKQQHINRIVIKMKSFRVYIYNIDGDKNPEDIIDTYKIWGMTEKEVMTKLNTELGEGSDDWSVEEVK
jgi:hypothetical protein